MAFTQLVSVKVKHLRPAYDNFEDWLQDPQNVYIGRAGRIFIGSGDQKRIFHYPSSPWHNPYKVGPKGYSLGDALALYRDHLEALLTDPAVKEEFLQLSGKTLGCWCCPQACHGDIIIQLLNKLQ